ncbi:MAG: hypothetical protein GY934_11955, partial [Gammaproteobacteria bacterium]|nr:hypothetical protein [Gammaproteobacteria bacterium]
MKTLDPHTLMLLIAALRFAAAVGSSLYISTGLMEIDLAKVASDYHLLQYLYTLRECRKA